MKNFNSLNIGILVVLFCSMYASILVSEDKVENPSVKLLTSFEKEQMLQWGGKEKKEGVITVRYNAYSSIRPIVKGDGSHGEWAIKGKYGKYDNTFYRTGKTRYNVLRRGNLFNTSGWSKKRLPLDWSGYDKLRIDIKSVSSPGLIRIELEDAICTPLLRREYKFPEGKWVTLEFDLKEASKIRSFKSPQGEEVKYRLLNLAKMANIFVWPVQMDKKTEILLDNLRLIKSDYKEEKPLDILKDESPFVGVSWLEKNNTTVVPTKQNEVVQIPDKIKVNTLDLKHLKKSSYARVGLLTKRAFSSVSPQKMLLGYLHGYLRVLKTNNAGVTWMGLDGKKKATKAYHSANAPSHVAVAAGPDLLYVHQDYCAGGANPTNMFFKFLKYENDNWVMKKPYLVDVSCRHCPEKKVRALRLPTGRIWASWMQYSRWSKNYIRAKYSDDGGVTWQDPDSNALFKLNQDNSQGPQQIGVTVWLEDKTNMVDEAKANGFIMKRAHSGGFELLRYGDQVACISETDWMDTIKFSSFDGKSWSKPKIVTKGRIISAATFGDKDIFFVFRNKKKKIKLFHKVEQKWIDETPEWMDKSDVILSANDNVLWAVWSQREDKNVVMYYSFKKKGKKWIAPVRIDSVEMKKRVGLQAPSVAPKGYLPIAWGPKFAWIKTCVIPLPSK